MFWCFAYLIYMFVWRCLQAAMWVLGTEPGSFGRETNDLKNRAIFPALFLFLKTEFYYVGLTDLGFSLLDQGDLRDQHTWALGLKVCAITLCFYILILCRSLCMWAYVYHGHMCSGNSSSTMWVLGFELGFQGLATKHPYLPRLLTGLSSQLLELWWHLFSK